MNRNIPIITLLVVAVTTFSIGAVYGMHLDYTNVECQKWEEIVDLVKPDYPYLIDDALKIAEMKC